MALKTFVKISAVSNLSDARYSAGMSVNLLGFILDKDNYSYISPEIFMELTGWVSGVEFVGEFGNASEDYIKAAIADYEIDYLQTDNPAIIPLFPNQKRILRFDIDQISDAASVKSKMKEVKDEVEFYLFESTNGNLYKEVVLKQVLDLAQDFPILLGFNINSSNISDLIRESDIKGISLKGGTELRPGFKNFDELADILEILEIDDTIEN